MTNNRKQITINMNTRKKTKRRTKNLAGNSGPTAVGQALRALGTAGGGALASYFGANPLMGSSVGSTLGGALSKWLGQGDYTLRANSIVQSSLNSTDGIPSMHKTQQSVVIRHKEYVTEVRGHPNFTVRAQLPINPGMRDTFPWLSRIAGSFQEYSIRGMVYHYVPTSGNAVASTNAALGSVMMQTTYRASDAAPTSKVELLNEYWASESVPSEGFCHPIECSPQENPFKIQYVRSGTIPAGDNVLLYDLGTTNLCVSGQQATDTVLGDLWVTYEIELRKPIVKSNTQDIIGGYVKSATGWSNAAPLGSTGITELGNSGISSTSNSITLPAQLVGDYLVKVSWFYSALTTWNAFASPTLTNCSFVQYQADGGSAPELSQNAGAGADVKFIVFAVRKDTLGNPATIAFPNLITTGSVNVTMELLVTQIE